MQGSRCREMSRKKSAGGGEIASLGYLRSMLARESLNNRRNASARETFPVHFNRTDSAVWAVAKARYTPRHS